MSLNKFVLLIPLLALPLHTLAQPAVDFVVPYDLTGSEQMLDVYALDDGTYVLCGSSTGGAFTRPSRGDPVIVKTDQAGNFTWGTRVDLAENNAFASCVIQADNGDFLCGGVRDGQFIAIRFSPEGELIWIRDYWVGICWGLIELKDGDFILAGDHDGGCLIRINSEGDVIWESVFTPGWLGHFYSLRQTEGGVVAAGYGQAGNNQASSPWAVKARLEDGEPIWNRIYPNEGDFITYGMTSSGDGGFTLAGTTLNLLDGTGQDFFALKIDGRGEQLWIRTYPRANYQYGRTITRLADGGYAILGESTFTGPPIISPAVIRTDPQGEVLWEATYRMHDGRRFDKGSNIFWGSTTGLDDEIIGCGAVKSHISGNYDGFLMRLHPDIANVTFLNYTPADTVFSVLPDTTVVFTVTPRDLDYREFGYRWTYLDTVRSTDTLCSITFDSLGEQIIECAVTQGDVETSVRWTVLVTDLYIQAFSPDTLDLKLRRGTSVTFAIDSVAMTLPSPANYLWVITNLENFERVELDTLAETIVDFTRAGDFAIEGNAYLGDLIDKVIWNVHVASTVRDFWPAALNLSVPLDTVIIFGVEPYAADSGQVRYEWRVDTTAVSDSAVAEIRFTTSGQHTISALVADTTASDTLIWSVNVRQPDAVGGSMVGLPTEARLSLSPNPFNAQATINYSLPQTGMIHLTVFDLNGREIARLSEGVRPAGNYATIWNANTLPAGIYLMKFQTEQATLLTKAVMLK